MFVANSQYFSLSSIEQGTESHTFDIGRYDFVFSVAISFWIRSSFHNSVNFVSSYFLVKYSNELSQRTSCNWNTLSRAIQFTLQCWDNKTDCFSSTSSVRDDVFSSCTSTTEVTFSMWSVKCVLVACVSMDCSHQTFNDTEVVVKSFSHRSQAVSCTRSTGDNCFSTIKDFMVNVVNNSFHVASSWSGDNNFLSATFKVFFSSFFSCEETCALKNDVYTKVAPRQFFRVTVSKNFNFFAVNFEETVMYFYFAIEFTLSCIIFQQMRQHFSVS
ncbi:hypothetical protein D3C81_1313100 [compost metagenome]